MTSERLHSKPTSDNECTCPTVPDAKGNPIKVPTIDTVCGPCRGVQEYAPGTILEDSEGDRWTKKPDGLFHCDVAGFGPWTFKELDIMAGPLKVVEEPVKLYDGPGIVPGINTFLTKDSGERAEFPSGMKRDTDKGKPRYELLFPEDIPLESQPLYREAMLMARGAEKYDARNWEKANPGGSERERFFGSALRHLIQGYMGLLDEDHYAATIFNVRGLMTLQAKENK